MYNSPHRSLRNPKYYRETQHKIQVFKNWNYYQKGEGVT